MISPQDRISLKDLPEPFYTITEMVERHSVDGKKRFTDKTIRRLIKTKKLKAIKDGKAYLIRDSWMEAHINRACN